MLQYTRIYIYEVMDGGECKGCDRAKHLEPLLSVLGAE